MPAPPPAAPRFGRDLAYAPFAAELLVVGSAPEVWRISLAEGRFLSPLPSRSPAINAAGVSPVHGLCACAGEDGQLECFDLRARGSVGGFDAAASCGAAGQELTALRFDDAGLHVAVGTHNGLVGLFDLRSQVLGMGSSGGGRWQAGRRHSPGSCDCVR